MTDLCASDYDVILPADVVRDLQAASVAVNVSSCDLGAVCDVGTETNDPEVEDNTPEDVDSLPIGEVEADATALLMEQEQDPTLATCWTQAQVGKGGFVVHKGLLYHRDLVEGQTVCQLELEERKAAREAEMKKVALESEAEARKAALEAESRRLEAEERRAEREARALEADQIGMPG